MGTYNVEFSGKLLAGFDPQEVRLHAATRLRMSDSQLDRVFDGRPIVLKKEVDAATGQRYLGELHRLGMASRLVELDAAPPPPPAHTYKVVFLGQLVDGFEKEAVALAAGRRLNIGPEQVTRLFSGKKVVLKRGVSERLGRRYMAELAALGMQTRLVDEQNATVSVPPPAQVATPSQPSLAQAAVEAVLPSPQAKVAGAVPDLEDMLGDQTRINPVSEAQLAALTATQFEMPQHLLASGELPEPLDDTIDHAATLLVDPARLVEQMNYAPLPLASDPIPDKPGALETESAVPYVRCAQCNHSQPATARCRRCGAELDTALATALAPALQVVSPAEPVPALVVSPVEPPPASTGLALEPLVETPPPAEAEVEPPPPPPPPARVLSLAEQLAKPLPLESAAAAADAARRKKLMIGGALIVVVLLILLLG